MKTGDKVYDMLRIVSKRLRLLQKEVLSDIDINFSYYKVFAVLALNGEITQTELSDICGMDKPAISRLVAKMSNDGYVQTIMRNGNRKMIYVSMTNYGMKIAQLIKEKVCLLKHKYFKELSEEKENILFELLTEVLFKEEENA